MNVSPPTSGSRSDCTLSVHHLSSATQQIVSRRRQPQPVVVADHKGPERGPAISKARACPARRACSNGITREPNLAISLTYFWACIAPHSAKGIIESGSMAFPTTQMSGYTDLKGRIAFALSRCQEQPWLDSKNRSHGLLRWRLLKTIMGMAKSEGCGLILVGVAKWNVLGTHRNHGSALGLL